MTARFGGPAGRLPAGDASSELDRRHAASMQASAGETVVRLLEQGNAGAILRFGIEADLVKILQHPTTSIACDCGAVDATRASIRAHYGTFPRVLGRYVRETKALTWEDAIRKMTALPASDDRHGRSRLLAAGMAADITVFDPGDGDRPRDLRRAGAAVRGDPPRARQRRDRAARRQGHRRARRPRADAHAAHAEPADEHDRTREGWR